MSILDRDRKLLWGRSGNRCAKCRRKLVEPGTPADRDTVVGDECHIAGQSSNGPRADALPDGVGIDSYENLLLLCKVDHKLIDEQVGQYTAQVLRQLKQAHEQWVEHSLEVAVTGDSEGQPLAVMVEPITNGTEFLRFIGPSAAYHVDYDEPATEMEAELMGELAQNVQDWVDIYDDVSAADRVKSAFDLTQLIQKLSHSGVSVWGGNYQDQVAGITVRVAVVLMNHSTVGSNAATQFEAMRRQQLIARLRNEYILSHDGISAGLMAGTEPVPKQWIEQRLKQMGEAWQQDQYL